MKPNRQAELGDLRVGQRIRVPLEPNEVYILSEWLPGGRRARLENVSNARSIYWPASGVVRIVGMRRK